MNSKVELWVNGTGTTNQGMIDLYPDEPISIQMANADIKDIKIRKSTFTQSFVIPGTKNNNQIFNSIFEIGIDCQFDPRKKTKAYLLVDSIPVMQNGNLQLTGIVVDDEKNIEYEITIFDETEDLIDAIGDNYLTDLKFDELDHVWDYTRVTNTWVSGNTPYYYPLIDYGYDFNLSDMNSGSGVPINWLLPATQAKYTFDKIFSAAGYSYNSSFLSGSYFTNLFVPFNSSAILTQDSGFTINRSFQAQASQNTGVTISLPATTYPFTPYGSAIPYDLPFTDDINAPNFDNGNLYIASAHTYSSDTYSNQIFNVQLNFQLDVTGSTVINGLRNFVQYFRSTYPFPYYVASDWPGGSAVNTPITKNYASPALNDPLSTTLYPAQPGETFYVRTFFNFEYSTTGETVTFNWLSGGTFFYNTVGTDAFPGQLINYNNFIPKKIKQIDFVNSLITMHNLYITPDKNNLKTLNIKPRNAYYSGGTVKNWSKKLDSKIKIKEQLISEQQNKRIIFSYTKDADFYNTDYQTITNKIFGDYYFNIDNDFTKDDKKIDVIFSPTPGVAVLQSSTSTTNYANEFVVPKIGKRDSSNNFGKTDSNIRILQKHSSGGVTLDSGDTWKLAGNTQSRYPYLGMLNHPSTGNTDIAFGQVDYEYYTLSAITSNNLVNAYWQEYLEQISDKDSKLITCNIYLTPTDIQQFDFSDSIFMDGLTDDGGHYFIVNKITYTPTSNESSEVELIKVKNKFVNTTKKNNIFSTAIKDGFQSISRGGGNSTSTGTVAIGPSVYIGAGSNRSFAIGNDNTVGDGSPRSFITGSGNTIFTGTQGAVIFGNDVSATTSNTVYVPNIIIASGGSINGISFSALTASTNLWSASTGANSIIANNGTGNKAGGSFSNVLGGYSNSAITNSYTTVVNGYQNKASGGHSTIINGRNNSALTNNFSTIVNGTYNKTTGFHSFVGGGTYNSAITSYSTVVNGSQNISSGVYSLIGNGKVNKTQNGLYSTILNGSGNFTTGVASFAQILNGNINTALTSFSTIINGQQNFVQADFGNINGGKNNLIYGIANYALIGNGVANNVFGTYGTVLNGVGNISAGANAGILNGYQNSIFNHYSSIVNGSHNNIQNDYSFIGTGALNYSNSFASFVGAGQSNSAITGNYAVVVGGVINKSSGVSSFIGNGNSNIASANKSTVLNGFTNNNSGIYSTILNGKNNILTGAHSSIVAGSGITSSLSESVIATHYAIHTGATQQSAGVVALIAGSITISTPKIAADSMVFVTVQSLSGIAAPVGVAVTARIPGTSFTITSASVLDTSLIAWWILSPAS